MILRLVLFWNYEFHSHFWHFFPFPVKESQSQWLKSHFPRPKSGQSQYPFYPFKTLCLVPSLLISPVCKDITIIIIIVIVIIIIIIIIIVITIMIINYFQLKTYLFWKEWSSLWCPLHLFLFEVLHFLFVVPPSFVGPAGASFPDLYFPTEIQRLLLVQRLSLQKSKVKKKVSLNTVIWSPLGHSN